MISFVLNLPYTLLGLIYAVLLGLREAKWRTAPMALVLRVKRTALFDFGYMKGWRGMALGNVVLLNPREEKGDLEHELVHIEQFARLPLIFPLLNYLEMLRKGYRYNKYENEAYTRAGNAYKER